LAITQESFDALLSWLDSNRENAGQKYEAIRSGLIRIFVSQGFSDAEDLTDLTINRVAVRLADIKDNYVGDPARYFHGVARNVIHEARRRKELTVDPPPLHLNQMKSTSAHYECLLQCLKSLPEQKRELILDYYLYQGRDKIKLHKLLAEELGITEGTLRTRVHHIRVALEKCVRQGINNLRGNE
jgi:RNA polymerase sigma factor (sigma-70 family)